MLNQSKAAILQRLMNEWLFSQTPEVIYLSLLGLLLAGAVGLPVPEDLPILLAGVLIHNDRVDPFTCFVICYFGILIGDLFIYFVGAKFGPSLFKMKWFQARFKQSKISHIRLNLEKRSYWMILLARHLFYLRTVTFLTCGAVRMRLSKFLLADALAGLISLPIMMWLGYQFSNHFDTLVSFFSQFKLLTGVIALGLLAIVARRVLRAAPKG